ncbi:MAG: hypothetical protein QM687_11050 [Ferruginibacter sp.]
MKVLLTLFTVIMMHIAKAQSFAGSFEGTYNGIAATANLQTTGNAITGSITINGRPGKVHATANGYSCEGILYDIQMQKNYAFTGTLEKDSLRLSVVFPELNNQAVLLLMQRLKPVDITIPSNGTINPALVGLWRYTETFSSGYGDQYASFSTDYFMEFKADGTVYSWTGKSAGGTAGAGISAGASGKQKGGWYTEGKLLYLTDPATGQKTSVQFYAEPDRLLLHNGGSGKKLLTRVRQ